MSASPYDWAEHEPGCACSDCRKVVPIRPAIPPAIKAELDRLKALWRANPVP